MHDGRHEPSQPVSDDATIVHSRDQAVRSASWAVPGSAWPRRYTRLFGGIMCRRAFPARLSTRKSVRRESFTASCSIGPTFWNASPTIPRSGCPLWPPDQALSNPRVDDPTPRPRKLSPNALIRSSFDCFQSREATCMQPRIELAGCLLVAQTIGIVELQSGRGLGMAHSVSRLRAHSRAAGQIDRRVFMPSLRPINGAPRLPLGRAGRAVPPVSRCSLGGRPDTAASCSKRSNGTVYRRAARWE